MQRSLLRLAPVAPLVLAALVLPATSTQGQGLGMRMSTVVDNMVGEAGDTYVARLLFAGDAEELCVSIAIRTGPTALRAPMFRFSRTAEGQPRAETLQFKLPKKPELSKHLGDRVQVWQACLPSPPADSAVERKIRVHYHDPRILKERAEYFVDYPAPQAARGIDVLKDSAGNLLFQDFNQVEEPPAG